VNTSTDNYNGLEPELDPSREDNSEQLEQKELAHKVTELSQQAYQLLKEDYLDEAESLFQEMLVHEPENNYALVGLGDAARKRRRFQQAVEYYQKCLETHPDNNYALFGLADCYKSMRHFHKAINIWERYLKYDDENITVLTRVADAYRKVRDLENSQRLYMRVLEMEPDNPYSLIGLGHLHYDFRDYRKALQFWERMYEINGDQVDIRVLTSIGNCHRKMKTFERGTFYFGRALDREPDNFYALFGMADCCRGLNRSEESLDYWNRILDKDPSNKVILTRAGDAYRGMGQHDSAEMYYNKALNIEYDTYAVIGLALINKAKGKYTDAIQALESVKTVEPKNHRLYTEIAECYLNMNDPRKALEVLHQFQKLGIRNRYVTDMLDRIRGSNR